MEVPTITSMRILPHKDRRKVWACPFRPSGRRYEEHSMLAIQYRGLVGGLHDNVSVIFQIPR